MASQLSALFDRFGGRAGGCRAVAAVQRYSSDTEAMRRANLQMGGLAMSSVRSVVVGGREVEIGAVDEESSLTRQNNGATPDSAPRGCRQPHC